ncbi:alkaline phosphatase [Litoribacter populi]|uniref:alkaline phosphatase n=1 Tax=Litoribacter populi TaxID=2598460 RepID=UPI00117E3E4D|nr:alkaline phosphatase [Litoribacter populi]
MRKLIFASLLVAAIGCKNDSEVSHLSAEEETTNPNNIILLIGDGMGVTQISSLYAFEDKTASFDRFKNIGFIKTASSDSRITDSAAGATAFASGIKTYNAAIGVDNDTVAVETIVEILSKAGWKTGLVATSSITHATPAAFFAHVAHRKMEEEIAKQLYEADLDIVIGGGEKYFKTRKDGINYLDSLKSKGYHVKTRSDQDLEIENPAGKEAHLMGESAMQKVSEGRGDFLTEASLYTINKLQKTNDNFFVMIEGSQIDWGGHANDHDYIVDEMLDFDKTINAVLDFAEKDGNTLVIVTADHETGGYALSSGKDGYKSVTGTFSTGGHTAALIPVFAFGPGSENFQGVYENNEIFHKMLESIK